MFLRRERVWRYSAVRFSGFQPPPTHAPFSLPVRIGNLAHARLVIKGLRIHQTAPGGAWFRVQGVAFAAWYHGPETHRVRIAQKTHFPPRGASLTSFSRRRPCGWVLCYRRCDRPPHLKRRRDITTHVYRQRTTSPDVAEKLAVSGTGSTMD